MQKALVFAVLLLLATAAGVTGQTLEPMTEGVIPVVAHLPGLGGSVWRTAVYVRQVSGSAPAQVTMTVRPPSGSPVSRTFLLPAADGALAVENVVHTIAPTLPDGRYILTWWSTQPVVVTSRTFTAGAGGTVGQGTGSVAPGSGFGADGQVLFPAPMEAASTRVNVGIANASGTAQTFRVDAVNATGGVVRTWTRVVAPWTVDQLRTNEGFTGVGSVAVRCTAGCNGNAFGYLSVVTNGSNDAFFSYAAARAGMSEVAPVATVRDAKGVWFITGGTLYDVFEAMGYAVATDRLWQAELFRRQARGTLAELFGASYLSQDVFVRVIGRSEAEYQAAFEALDAESKVVIRAYVDGFNRRIAELRANPALVPYEFKALSAQFGQPVMAADWTIADVLAWAALLQRNFDPEALDTGQLDNAALVQKLTAAFGQEGLAMFQDLRWINDPAAQTMIPASGLEASPLATSAPPRLNGDLPEGLAEAAGRLRQRRDERNDKLERLGVLPKMGSYAWVVSGEKTASGNPILYSGPQMGFSAPAITLEGSIHGGGLSVSGMTVAGIPGIIVGRTPHHAWSMQVGHGHSVDFYLESPAAVSLHRMETIRVAGAAPVTIPIFRTPRGPVVEPVPYNPASPPAVIVSWKYAHWDVELQVVRFALGVARAQSMDEFGRALDFLGVSQHFCYADRDGNIAYWMSGHDPVRPAGVDPRLPLKGDGSQEWPVPLRLKPRAHDRNTRQGFYGGWNNKAAVWYANSSNDIGYTFGPAHRAHVIDEYLKSHNNLTFEEVRDLALYIATTDSFGGGGNTWTFVKDRFKQAVAGDSTPARAAAVALLDGWDGHFVAGGPPQWVAGDKRADAWVLQDAWVKEVIRLTFEDELQKAGVTISSQGQALLFNVLLHALAGPSASVPKLVDWFADRAGSGKPTTADGIIVAALDTVLAALGPQPWNRERGLIRYRHPLLGELSTTPFASRSTFAHVVEYGSGGPLRLESMIPLGQSGNILGTPPGQPQFDPHFFSMKPVFDAFAPRPFPLPQ